MSIINNINISGPLNIVRLEGEINGNNKVLYLFFDYHTRETKCNDYSSIDIVQLFDKFTKESVKFKNEWDLFIESDINFINNKKIIEKSIYSGIYIGELIDFFDNKFSEVVNKVVKRKDNIRYHYFDFRGKLNENIIYSSINNLLNTNSNDIFYNKFEKIYKLILEDYDFIFKKENKINNKYNNSKLENIILYILKEYEKVYIILLKEFNDLLKDIKKNSDKFFKKVLKNGFYDYYYSNEVKSKINDLQDRLFWINANIIDLYFLRRYLDKSYIKNGVIYSGASHSINIIYILVKLFDFKITNASYSKIKLDKLNKFVKKSKNYLELKIQLWPEKFIQCSSMEGFPDMFL